MYRLRKSGFRLLGKHGIINGWDAVISECGCERLRRCGKPENVFVQVFEVTLTVKVIRCSGKGVLNIVAVAKGGHGLTLETYPLSVVLDILS